MEQLLRPLGVWALENPITFFAILLAALVWGSFWVLRPDRIHTQFKSKEHQRTRSVHSQSRSKDEPLLLAHSLSTSLSDEDVLGVSSAASEKEIRRAYRERMKEYHPDRLKPQNATDWARAQQIAARINDARDRLLKKKSD